MTMYSKEDKAQMIKLYKDYRSAAKVANELNISTRSVLNCLHEENITIYRRYYISEEEKQAACELYESGLSEDAVGDAVGLCRTTIRKILRENHIHIRTQDELDKKYPINEDYFDNIDTQNKAYILGLLYADGNVSSKTNLIQIGLQARDLHILESIKKEFGCMERTLSFDQRSLKNPNKQDMYVLGIKNKHMHNALAKWGVIPCKTKILKYPDFLSTEFHRHFIRGVMDGDGCIHATLNHLGYECKSVDICGTYEFCCGTKQIIEQYLDIYCGVVCKSKAQNSDTYKVVISGQNQCLKFLDWIYEDSELFLYRKYEIYLSKFKNVA